MFAHGVRTCLVAGSCAISLLVTACARLSTVRSDDTVVAHNDGALAAFAVSGRLSAHHADDAFAAGFHWQHDPRQDVMDFISPLGQTVAQLQGGEGSVELRTAKGEVITADGWSALTRRGLGWPLPVDGLAFWIQGAPRPGGAFTAERDPSGRLSVLWQDGWTIAYQAFAPDANAAARPSRMTLNYPEVELRVVIDNWQ